MSRFLIIGATGTVGREVVSQLTASNGQVRALVRNPALLTSRWPLSSGSPADSVFLGVVNAKVPRLLLSG
jgi:uncharacterized protein YbjT (DUF2867 family)